MENNEKATAWIQESGSDIPWQQPRQPRKLFDLTRKDTAFALGAVAVCIFSSVFGIFGGFALGYFLSLILMMTLFAVYFAKVSKLHAFAVACGLLALMHAAVFICTTNVSVRFFSTILSFLLALVSFDGLINGVAVGNRQTLGVFYTAAATAGNIAAAVKSLFTKGNGDRRSIGKALVGLLCAIPVMVIVVPLLVSSDDAFRGMMDRLFSDTHTTVFRAVFGVLLSVFVIAYGFSMKARRNAKCKPGKFAGIENVYIISFLSAIGLCYVLYLFSQLAYFFSAFRGFLPDGEITYAQYARKGFFEMCVIAVINLVLVLSALLLAKKQEGKVCHGIKALATFIAVFTLIIIATAISKMVLYIDAYGMTVLRLTTSAFMVFLSVVFVSVILRIYITRINIVKVALLAAGCTVLALGIINVNSVCARYNYESYRSGKLASIDIQSLNRLGDEGIPYIVKLAGDEDTQVAQTAKEYLSTAYLYHYFDNMWTAESFTVDTLKKNEKNQGFSCYSIPRAVAYNSLYKYIEQNPEFANLCKDYFTGVALHR